MIKDPIQHNSRLIRPSEIPEVVRLHSFIRELDEKYGVDSTNRENSFGQLDMDKPLLSYLYESNIYFWLFGGGDISNLPKQAQTKLPYNTVLMAGQPFANSSPLQLEPDDKQALFQLREEARDAIEAAYPKIPETEKVEKGYAKNISFQITDKVKDVFTVSYKGVRDSKPYFSTRYRTDQSQQELPTGGLAFQFYKKWDVFHLVPMSKGELKEMERDLEELKTAYPWRNSSDREWNEPDKAVKLRTDK